MKQGFLGNFVQFAYGKGLPARNRKTGSVPVYGSAGVIDTHNTALVHGPGVVVGRKGTVGAVHWADRDFYPIDTTYYVVSKCKDIRMRYVYYLLKTLPLPQMNTDAAVPGLNRTNALRLKVNVASPSTQDRIIEILSAYDDLIENNRRRIQLLEQAARLIYKEWFVHLRFPGHEHAKIIDGVPEGWERKTLGEIVDVTKGRNITKDSAKDGPVPVVAGGLSPAYYHDTANVVGPVITISASGANAGYAKDIKRLPLLVPKGTIVSMFEELVSHNFHQVKVLLEQNKLLEQARDLLLPRLMNGEVAVCQSLP